MDAPRPDPSDPEPHSAQHEQPPSYDTSSGDYAGISSVGLEDVQDLRAAKNFAEMIVDTVREGLLVLDLDLHVKAANESFYEIFQVSPEETLGRLVYDLGNGQWEIPELHRLLDEILPDNNAFNDLTVTHTFEHVGRKVLLLNARRLNDHQMILLAIEDITERRSTEEALRTSEERYRLLVEGTREYAMLILDPGGQITTWNTGAERIFGYSEDEAVGRAGAIIFTEAQRARGVPEEEMATAAREGQAADERWHVRQDGTRFWGSGVMTRLRDADGGLRGFAKVLRDNTRRKEAEEAIKALNETLEARVRERTRQVRELASSLTMAEQQERRRISHILHDDLQQQLYGVQLKLSCASQDAETGRADRLREDLATAETWLQQCVELTRSLTVDLSPPFLESEGLADELTWLQSQMKEVHDLDVEIDVETPLQAPEEDIRVLLYQIVRELLFNVAKHAGTKQATVALRDVDQHVEVVVADEGAGFDLAAAEARTVTESRFGLFSVRERLALFGGHMHVASSPGAGTRVTVVVPRQSA